LKSNHNVEGEHILKIKTYIENELYKNFEALNNLNNVDDPKLLDNVVAKIVLKEKHRLLHSIRQEIDAIYGKNYL